MTNDHTVEKLRSMRMSVMAEALADQLKDQSFSELSFEERLGILVDLEYTSRKNNRLTRMIKQANFDQPQASLSDINYSAGRKLDKSMILRLGSCEFIEDAHNLIIMGATGAGKSYLACAFGMEACKRSYSVRYIRLPDLLNEVMMARGEGTYHKLMKQYRKVQLLIIDEWMLVSLTDSESRDLLEIIHARHKRASTIFCSQFAPAGWHGKINEATIADAILDRIVHDSYTIQIHSDKNNDRSMREVYGINQVDSRKKD